MLKTVNDGGSVLFVACYAGWTSESIGKIDNPNNVNIYLNFDYSSGLQNKKKTYMYLPLGKDLTRKERHRKGWVNAKDGTRHNNMQLSSTGKIIPID